ncbi:MAG TPA: hypothetical protein VF838_17660 [Trebonia sp.]
MLDLLPDQPRGRRRVSGQPRVLVEDADHRRHRGQGSPQLVRHVARELAGACLHLLQLAHLALQGGSHPVERGDQLGELVAALRLDPDRQVTAGHAPRGLGQPPYRQHDRPVHGDGDGGHHREQQRGLDREEDQGGMGHQAGWRLPGIADPQIPQPLGPEDHLIQQGREAVRLNQGVEP